MIELEDKKDHSCGGFHLKTLRQMIETFQGKCPSFVIIWENTSRNKTKQKRQNTTSRSTCTIITTQKEKNGTKLIDWWSSLQFSHEQCGQRGDPKQNCNYLETAVSQTTKPEDNTRSSRSNKNQDIHIPKDTHAGAQTLQAKTAAAGTVKYFRSIPSKDMDINIQYKPKYQLVVIV